MCEVRVLAEKVGYEVRDGGVMFAGLSGSMGVTFVIVGKALVDQKRRSARKLGRSAASNMYPKRILILP